jgi:hypothetical protein
LTGHAKKYERICDEAVALAIIIIVGIAFQPLTLILFRSDLYFAVVEAILSRKKLSLQ